MSTAWITQQLLAIKRTAEPERFNPRPQGICAPGSATDAVLTWLVERRGSGRWTYRQIVSGTRCTPKSVDWALIYLRHVGAVESLRDDRNPRYMSYRAVMRVVIQMDLFDAARARAVGCIAGNRLVPLPASHQNGSLLP